MRHTFTVEEEQRQALVLALALMALQRPGWDDLCRRIAVQLGDRDLAMYQGFQDANR